MANKQHLQSEWTRWLARYPWTWFVTLTFRYGVHPEQAHKRFMRFVHIINQQLYGRNYHKRPGTGIYWVLALEYQKRGVIHFHALMADDFNLNTRLSRKVQEQRWEKMAGFARIYPIDDRMTAVTGYVSKYVAKDGELEVSETMRGWIPSAQPPLEPEP